MRRGMTHCWPFYGIAADNAATRVRASRPSCTETRRQAARSSVSNLEGMRPCAKYYASWWRACDEEPIRTNPTRPVASTGLTGTLPLLALGQMCAPSRELSATCASVCTLLELRHPDLGIGEACASLSFRRRGRQETRSNVSADGSRLGQGLRGSRTALATAANPSAMYVCIALACATLTPCQLYGPVLITEPKAWHHGHGTRRPKCRSMQLAARVHLSAIGRS